MNRKVITIVICSLVGVILLLVLPSLFTVHAPGYGESSALEDAAPSIIVLLLIFAAPIITFITVRMDRKTNRGINLSDDDKKKFGAIFVEPTERYISSLGNGYLINFLVDGVITSGFSMISNKRVYFKGKCFYKEKGKLKRSFEERIVDLKDVTGTGYTRVNPMYLLISAGVTLLAAISMIIVNANLDQDNIRLFFITLSCLVATSVALTMYILKRTNLFEISFAGGKIAFDIKLYDKSEIDDFQKQIRIAKDSILELAQSQVAAAQSVSPVNSKLGVADELKKYAELLQQKLITVEEYELVKKRLLIDETKN
ncbi:SHOCT domain-containing protein [Cohnella massiliensis]|uniref:SHOCT domain-containing protein n=1 Tax=Cohnella massiliensis TaxID=1816691 RepID=UPI0009BBDE5F|nr:SHOCT domain-containing protein [Cohnella massiliensis]